MENHCNMHSGIYEGKIRHRRFAPVVNVFSYPLCMMYLDLSELDLVFDKHFFWSVNRFNLACLKREDHLVDPEIPLEQAVRDLVEEKLGERPQGPIRMLTHLRYFGHCFNPVSFYYCYDEADEQLETIVAEITNTPWHERHYYVLGEGMNEGRGLWKKYRLRKDFHVSPFMDMDIDYDWRFRRPDQRLGVHLQNFIDGKKIFDATLKLQRREITAQNLRRVLIRYPVMTMQVVARIHLQALCLWLKGSPFYTHPGKRKPNAEIDHG